MLKKDFPCDRQMDRMDCGPACLKMIAKFYGKFYSLQYLRDKCGITREGVSFSGLSHAAEGLGLRSLSLKCSSEELLTKLPLPAIAHWDNSHFIVVYKTRLQVAKSGEIKGAVYVSDPAKGLLKYQIDDFCKKWIRRNAADDQQSKGRLIALAPQADFYERQAHEKTKTSKNLCPFH